MADLSNPLTRIEQYLAGIAGVLEAVPDPPLTRIEEYLAAINGHLENVESDIPTPEQVCQVVGNTLIAAAYDPESSYTTGDYVTHGGELHVATADSAEPAGEFVAADWTPIKVTDIESGSIGYTDYPFISANAAITSCATFLRVFEDGNALLVFDAGGSGTIQSGYSTVSYEYDTDPMPTFAGRIPITVASAAADGSSPSATTLTMIRSTSGDKPSYRIMTIGAFTVRAVCRGTAYIHNPLA